MPQPVNNNPNGRSKKKDGHKRLYIGPVRVPLEKLINFRCIFHQEIGVPYHSFEWSLGIKDGCVHAHPWSVEQPIVLILWSQ